MTDKKLTPQKRLRKIKNHAFPLMSDEAESHIRWLIFRVEELERALVEIADKKSDSGGAYSMRAIKTAKKALEGSD